MSDTETPTTECEPEAKPDTTPSEKDYGPRLDAIEKRQSEHGGVLAELRDMISGFTTKAAEVVPETPPAAEPEAATETRPQKKARLKWIR